MIDITITEKVIPRFWRKVNKLGPDDCWEWKPRRDRGGYGHFWIKKVDLLAHRASWIIANGPIPNLYVLHKCDNRACVNPNHLFLGTHLDNLKDMFNKGRNASNLGVLNPNSKLSEKDVFDIIELKKSGVSFLEISNRYNVTTTCVKSACNGKAWSHITGIIFHGAGG